MEQQPQAPVPLNSPDRDEHDDYEAASRSMATYAQTQPPKETGGRKWLAIFAVIAVIIIIAIGIYWFLLRPKPAKLVPAAATTTTNQNQQQPSATKISATTKHYDSANFNLGLDYPNDWTVTDNGGGVMTIKSPSLSVKDASGQSQAGMIVLTIRDKTQKLNEFSAGNATAVLDSEKIAYTRPTQTQRGSTYISFLQYATTTANGALDGIYITGDSGYQKGQAIPMVDISKVDPVINLTFQNGAGKPLSIASSQWSDQAFAGPLKSLLQSLSIN